MSFRDALKLPVNSDASKKDKTKFHSSIALNARLGLATLASSKARLVRRGNFPMLMESGNDGSRHTECKGGNHGPHVKYTYNRTRKRLANSRKSAVNIIRSGRKHAVVTGDHVLIAFLSSDGVMQMFHHGDVEELTKKALQTKQVSELDNNYLRSRFLYPDAAETYSVSNVFTFQPLVEHNRTRKSGRATAQVASDGRWPPPIWTSGVEEKVGETFVNTTPFVKDQYKSTSAASLIHQIQRHEAAMAREEDSCLSEEALEFRDKFLHCIPLEYEAGGAGH